MPLFLSEKRHLTSENGIYRFATRTEHEDTLSTILNFNPCRERRALYLNESLYHVRDKSVTAIFCAAS